MTLDKILPSYVRQCFSLQQIVLSTSIDRADLLNIDLKIRTTSGLSAAAKSTAARSWVVPCPAALFPDCTSALSEKHTVQHGSKTGRSTVVGCESTPRADLHHSLD